MPAKSEFIKFRGLVVIHPGPYGKRPKKEAVELGNLDDLLGKALAFFPDAPEDVQVVYYDSAFGFDKIITDELFLKQITEADGKVRLEDPDYQEDRPKEVVVKKKKRHLKFAPVQISVDGAWTGSSLVREKQAQEAIDAYRDIQERDGTSHEQAANRFLWQHTPKMENPCFFNRLGTLTSHIYAHRGEFEQVQQCIRDGRDVNERDKEGRTVLSIATMEEHADIVLLLCDNGANPDLLDDNTGLAPLHHAVAQGHEKLVEKLMSAGADLNIADPAGMTPLMLAAQEGLVDVLAALIEESIHPTFEGRLRVDIVDVKDNKGWTPLHYAAHHGQLDCAQYLLEEGDCNMHMKDKAKMTAADLTIREDHGDVTAYLNSQNPHLHSLYEVTN